MWTHAEHAVDPAQYEPGVALEDQAHDHILDFALYMLRLRQEYVFLDDWVGTFEVPVHAANVSAHFHGADGEPLPSFESIHHRDETLLEVGDPQIGTRWRALAPSETSPWSLELSAGVTLPLGTTEPDPFVLGAQGTSHQHVFFGTGTWDPVAGLELRYLGEGWATRLWTAGRLSLYANEHHYQGPNVIEAGLGWISGWGLDSVSFLLEAGLMHETPASWSGARARNSGRTEVLANVGLSWTATPSWGFSLLAKRPIYTQVLGGQMEMPLLVVLSASYTTSLATTAPAQ